MTGSCHGCGRVLESNAFGRNDHCPGCEADTRCCRNCEFEEPGYRSECRETQAESIADKDRSNSCEYFRYRKGPPRGKLKAKDPGGKAAFDALFRKKPAS